MKTRILAGLVIVLAACASIAGPAEGRLIAGKTDGLDEKTFGIALFLSRA